MGIFHVGPRQRWDRHRSGHRVGMKPPGEEDTDKEEPIHLRPPLGSGGGGGTKPRLGKSAEGGGRVVPCILISL